MGHLDFFGPSFHWRHAEELSGREESKRGAYMTSLQGFAFNLRHWLQGADQSSFLTKPRQLIKFDLIVPSSRGLPGADA